MLALVGRCLQTFSIASHLTRRTCGQGCTCKRLSRCCELVGLRSVLCLKLGIPHVQCHFLVGDSGRCCIHRFVWHIWSCQPVLKGLTSFFDAARPAEERAAGSSKWPDEKDGLNLETQIEKENVTETVPKKTIWPWRRLLRDTAEREGRAGRGLVRSGTLRLDGVAALLPPSATSHGTFPTPSAGGRTRPGSAPGGELPRRLWLGPLAPNSLVR